MPPQNKSSDYQKVKDVFLNALEIAPENRPQFLAENCADEYILAEVESLLEAREDAGDFLNHVSAVDTIKNLADGNGKFIGQKIKDYRIEREIGRGGMGVVFLATREDFHQQAAIKLIKRGMDSDAILERFTREREILAALNHPFIARLTDGGTTSDGVPFFVMEYVEGVPVDEYCKNNDLSENETLDLFRKVCEAVAFAHRKLVVHRDLKPSNILVTSDGTPKLLDFGIAKLLNSTEINETQTNQRVLTPAYASPEQICGKPVDTTSDVYSLGKILSELLQAVDDKSVTATTSKNKIHTTINNFNKSLSIDLRVILQTAMREETTRRYNSVEKFADDVRRYQNALPISARKDTFTYRAAKFMRRNSASVSVALLLLLTLLGGLAATLWQTRAAQIERARAERRSENLRKISSSFVIELHDEIIKLPGSLPARQLLLQRGIEQLDTLAQDSDGNADLQKELAEGYYNLGEMPDLSLEETERNRQKGVAIYQNLLESDAQNLTYRVGLANGFLMLADIQKMRGDFKGGLNFARKSSEILEKVVTESPENLEYQSAFFDSLNETASFLDDVGQAQEGLEVGRRALTIGDKLAELQPENHEFQEMKNNSRSVMSSSLFHIGDYEGARLELQPAYRETLAQHLKEPENVVFRYILWALNRRLSEIFAKEGNTIDALKSIAKAREFIEKLAAESPKDIGYQRNTSYTLLSNGKILIRAKQPAQAIIILRRALVLSEKIFAGDTEKCETIADLAAIHGNLGEALIQTGNRAEGIKQLRESLVFYQKAHANETASVSLRRDYAETSSWLETSTSKISSQYNSTR